MLGDLTLKEFVKIFDKSNEAVIVKEGNILKKRISTQDNIGKIYAVFHPILQYKTLVDGEQGKKKIDLQKIQEFFGTTGETSNCSSALNKVYGTESMGNILSEFHKKNEKRTDDVKIKELIEYLKKYSEKHTKKYLLSEWAKPVLDVLEKDDDEKGQEESEEKMGESIKDLIAGAKQIILTGAPGTGKTYIAKNIAKEKGTDLTWKNKVNGKYPKYEFVQFHPSYDYTDFVEGLRPVEDENGEIKFQKVDGIFKKFCREVVNAKNKEGKYFFIIDEINRADLSKVFGELMYCLESDKRGADNKIQTQYANLPTYNPKTKSKYEPDTKDKNKSDTNEDKYNLDVFADGFYIPENVYIIGTMNDIDRSVESMDFALRRRFIWKEIKVPKKEDIEDILQDMFKMEEGLKDRDTNFIKDLAESIAKYIIFVNKKIESRPELNEQYDISQGQFANIPVDAEVTVVEYIKRVWDLRLRSLLYEYVRGEGKEEEFVESCSYEKYKESSDNKEQSSGDQNND